MAQMLELLQVSDFELVDLQGIAHPRYCQHK
jgi:hypothetical protein